MISQELPMTKSATISITNFYANGDYTARVAVGSQGTIVNLILDTGSSTLAVKSSKYSAADDTALQATSFAQDVSYGTGGWAGPLVQTKVSFGDNEDSITLEQGYLAITDASLPNNFGNADGILGLAYKGLNQGYDLSAFFQQHQLPPITFPWPFTVANSATGLGQLMSLFQTLQFEDIPPCFAQLQQEVNIPNKFAFYTLRSYPSLASQTPETDPINQGFFVLGGGEEKVDLYTGSFVNVPVLDDLYYNVGLKAVQVGQSAIQPVAPLSAGLKQTLVSNAIVDSGTNSLCLAPDVWKSVLAGFEAVNPGLVALIQQGSANGVDQTQIDLSQWPNVDLILSGMNGEEVRLTVAPKTYWQFDALIPGQAFFVIESGGMPQSILGLPLMNNYYTVFDRSLDAYGTVRFAAISGG
jgi:hypothetical protein